LDHVNFVSRYQRGLKRELRISTLYSIFSNLTVMGASTRGMSRADHGSMDESIHGKRMEMVPAVAVATLRNPPMQKTQFQIDNVFGVGLEVSARKLSRIRELDPCIEATLRRTLLGS
jgi:hypothetical protein